MRLGFMFTANLGTCQCYRGYTLCWARLFAGIHSSMAALAWCLAIRDAVSRGLGHVTRDLARNPGSHLSHAPTQRCVSSRTMRAALQSACRSQRVGVLRGRDEGPRLVIDSFLCCSWADTGHLVASRTGRPDAPWRCLRLSELGPETILELIDTALVLAVDSRDWIRKVNNRTRGIDQ